MWRFEIDVGSDFIENSRGNVLCGIRSELQDPQAAASIRFETRYSVAGVYARSISVLLEEHLKPAYLFDMPDHPWFAELRGIGRTPYLKLASDDEEQWELHLAWDRSSRKG